MLFTLVMMWRLPFLFLLAGVLLINLCMVISPSSCNERLVATLTSAMTKETKAPRCSGAEVKRAGPQVLLRAGNR